MLLNIDAMVLISEQSSQYPDAFDFDAFEYYL